MLLQYCGCLFFGEPCYILQGFHLALSRTLSNCFPRQLARTPEFFLPSWGGFHNLSSATHLFLLWEKNNKYSYHRDVGEMLQVPEGVEWRWLHYWLTYNLALRCRLPELCCTQIVVFLFLLKQAFQS